MGRAKGGNNAAYAPPRGRNAFQGAGRGAGQRGRGRHVPTPQRGRSIPNGPAKFHEQDMRHIPNVLKNFHQLRDAAMKCIECTGRGQVNEFDAAGEATTVACRQCKQTGYSRPVLDKHALDAALNDHLKPLEHGETREQRLAAVHNALRNGRIVEVNDGGGHDARMLVRDEHGWCVVYSATMHRVITAWWNDPRDDHATLDLSPYQPLRAEAGQRISAVDIKNAQATLGTVHSRAKDVIIRRHAEAQGRRRAHEHAAAARRQPVAA